MSRTDIGRFGSSSDSSSDAESLLMSPRHPLLSRMGKCAINDSSSSSPGGFGICVSSVSSRVTSCSSTTNLHLFLFSFRAKPLKECSFIPVNFASALVILRMSPEADNNSRNSRSHVARDTFHIKLPEIKLLLSHNILPPGHCCPRMPPRPMSGLFFPGPQVARGRLDGQTQWQVMRGKRQCIGLEVAILE